MAEYKLSYTGAEVNAKLSQIDNLAKKSEVPTKTSDLTNDSGFLTQAPVTSVNGRTGAVSISAASIGAVTNSQLNSAISTALAQAKASGEFDGAPGEPGQSAYEYAQDGGYTGTEAEFTDKMAAIGDNVTGTGIKAIIKITQEEYDAMASHDSETLYVIEG